MEAVPNAAVIMDEDDFLDQLIDSTEFLLFSTESMQDISTCNQQSSEYSHPLMKTSQDREYRLSTPATKKRKLDYTPLPLGDSRLYYVKDFINSLNGADVADFSDCLRKIAIPKLVMVCKKNNPTPDHVVPADLEIVGIEAIVKVLEQYFVAIPDMVCTIVREKSRAFENGESCLGCVYEVSGSKMYQIEGLAEGATEKIVLESLSVDSSSSVPNSAVVLSSVLKIGEAQARKVFNLRYTLTMHVNIMKRVFLMTLITE